MHHVITRRFKRYLDEKDIDIAEATAQGAQRPKFAYPPQLVVVDGGKPQVNAAAKALRELGITDVALCGLAKRLEEVWLPNNSEPIIFPRHSEALYLLQKLRDEAHRFAINFHRSKRSKVMLESLLDEVSGLGEIRRKSLLSHFGSVTALKAASVDELASVPGIGAKMAQTIMEQIKNQDLPLNIDMQTGEILDA
jgi:excinuclease ABC subunit C